MAHIIFLSSEFNIVSVTLRQDNFPTLFSLLSTSRIRQIAFPKFRMSLVFLPSLLSCTTNSRKEAKGHQSELSSFLLFTYHEGLSLIKTVLRSLLLNPCSNQRFLIFYLQTSWKYLNCIPDIFTFISSLFQLSVLYSGTPFCKVQPSFPRHCHYLEKLHSSSFVRFSF
jgi:hypothetical protein